MARLTAVAIRSMKHPGGNRPIRVGDGGGLYLQVAPGGSKSWLFRFTLRGKAREMGLGPVGDPPAAVPLAEARSLAAEQRGLLRQGIDPIEARRAAERAKAAAAPDHTFRAVTDFYVAAHEAGWRGMKFRKQWRKTLEDYAFPHFGEHPIAQISTGDVMNALEPIWRTKPETATRVRGRIEAVLDYARTRGWREGENPARWKGHLSNLLPARSKVARVEHHSALPWREVGAFMAELRKRESTAARALELVILTAARSGEVFGMRWGEVDLDGALWSVPPQRMKAGKEHRVPLSPAAVTLLRFMLPSPEARPAPDALVFPGERRGKPLSGMAMLMLLRRMNPHSEEKPARWRDPRTDEPITPHGFRSTFRDWTAEHTSYPRELAEAALAHTLGSKVEAAYQRGDMLEKRRRLMEDWARFCDRPQPLTVASSEQRVVAAADA